MSNRFDFLNLIFPTFKNYHSELAGSITKAASKQTYYTIRFLVDRDLVADAYRAYAYFRWLDDCLDEATGTQPEKTAIVHRQESLLKACYRGDDPGILTNEEQMLADLIRADLKRNEKEKNCGLQSYLRNMMAVMSFDVRRRGRLISQAELSEYSRLLATAVTEAMHYFIGYHCPTPCSETRYLAVRGAHIAHMLRDMLEDTAGRYFNIPSETIEAYSISVHDVDALLYRRWVYGRVKLAQQYFRAGRGYIAQVKNLRCRLAGFAYIARFEWMLEAIERDGYRLRTEYPERKSLRAGLWMVWRTMSSLLGLCRTNIKPRKLAINPIQSEEL